MDGARDAGGSARPHGTGSEPAHGTGSESAHGTGSESAHGTNSEQARGAGAPADPPVQDAEGVGLRVGGRSERAPGTVELVVGPMFSGKTEEVMRRVRCAAYAEQPCLLIKHASDTRYESATVVVSHDGSRQGSTPGSPWCAAIRVVAAEALAAVEVREAVVCVDEGQFFPDLLAACERWAGEGRRVIVAALDGDYLRRPFGQVCDLVPRCEAVEKKKGVCMDCRARDSAFTQRLGPGQALIEVGARESYRAVCRGCYARARAPPPGPEPGAPPGPRPRETRQ